MKHISPGILFENKHALICQTQYMYRKNPKISDTRKFAVITLKVEQDGLSLE